MCTDLAAIICIENALRAQGVTEEIIAARILILMARVQRARKISSHVPLTEHFGLATPASPTAVDIE